MQPLSEPLSPQEQLRRQTEEKRRQEALEREPVKLEEDTQPEANSENQDFSSLVYSTAPVPRQQPPKPPSRLHMEEMLNHTHTCLECGDEFLFESSLDHHYNRKSIVIEVILVKIRSYLHDRGSVRITSNSFLISSKNYFR